MKGLSLPIEMVVIIAVAIVVLIAVAAFFMGGFLPPVGLMSDQSALAQGCTLWQQRGCIKSLDEMTSIFLSGYNPYGCKGDGTDTSTNCDASKYNTQKGATLQIACARVGKSDTTECYSYCCGRAT